MVWTQEVRAPSAAAMKHTAPGFVQTEPGVVRGIQASRKNHRAESEPTY
jgi:hypothetical protein